MLNARLPFWSIAVHRSSAVVLREFCIAVFNKPCDVAIIKSGMDHKPSFACTVTWPVKGSVGTGTAGSKKEAEKRAYDQLACVLEEKARFIVLNETHTSPAPAPAPVPVPVPVPAPVPPAAACASFSSTAALHEFMKANRIVMTLETFGTGFRATCACYAVENTIKVLAYGKDIASVTEESLAKMRLELEQLKVLRSQFDVK